MKKIIGALLSILPISVFGSVKDVAISDLESQIKNDVELVRYCRDGLQGILEYMDTLTLLFPAERQKDKVLFTQEQRSEMRQVWSNYLDYHMYLEQVVNQYDGYDEIRFSDKISTEKFQELKNEAFKVYRAAFSVQYRFAMEFFYRANNNRQSDKILNDESPELGLSKDSYADVKYDFLNVKAASKFAAIETINRLWAKNSGLWLSDSGEDIVEKDVKRIWELGKGKGELMTLKNAVTIVKRKSKSAILPTQTEVSEWMGDTKVYRKNQALISQEQIFKIKEKLLPGDILLERREWYLSNIGLPGYWSHVALYIGSPEERKAFFADEQIVGWLQKNGITDGDYEKLIKSKFPEQYQASQKLWHDHSPSVIEAISDGVVFTSLEYSAAADSVAVLRPKLSKLEKAKAILHAFGLSGRPYDFSFDFQRDSALVCTELVYKAYEGHLKFEIPKMMGHFVLPANDFAKQFAETYLTDEQQFDFVVFVDGNEYEKSASFSDLEAFKESWKRPKWHILTKKGDG